jgi:hypothetical protein
VAGPAWPDAWSLVELNVAEESPPAYECRVARRRFWKVLRVLIAQGRHQLCQRYPTELASRDLGGAIEISEQQAHANKSSVGGSAKSDHDLQRRLVRTLVDLDRVPVARPASDLDRCAKRE